MSLIQKIRKRQGLLMVMIGFGMLSFLIPYDAVMALFGSGSNRDLGSVDGTAISALEFQQEVQLRRNLGFSGEQLADEVWNDFVSRILLQDGYDALGLQVTDKEFQGLLFEDGYSGYLNMAFYSNAQNKEFWQQQFSAMLGTPEGKTNFMMYRKLITQKRLREKYDNLLLTGVYANTLEAKQDYIAANKKVDFQYAFKAYSSVPDEEIEVSESQVKAFYNEHKNEPKYKQRAGRDLTYVRIPVMATEADAQTIQQELNDLKTAWTQATGDSAFLAGQGLNPVARRYTADALASNADEAALMNAQPGTIVGPFRKGNDFRLAKVVGFATEPDSVSCRHILLQATDPSDKTEMASLMKRADSLKAVLKKGGSFDDLVTRFSDDPGSKSTGGKYENFPRGQMVAPFEDFCFEQKPGSIGAVETSFGVHLIEVLKHSEAKKGAEIFFVDRPVTPSDETARAAYASASEFAIGVKDLDGFMNKASELGYPTTEAKDLVPGATAVTGIQNAAELVGWAFTAEEGKISSPLLTDNAYVIAILQRIKEAGVPEFEHIEEAMRAGAIQEAKAEKFKSQMQGSDLNAVAQSAGGTVQVANGIALKFPTITEAGAAPEPLVVGTAMGMEKGKMSEPIVGNNGVWVISTQNVTEAPEKTEFTSEQTALFGRAKGGFNNRVFNAMSEAAEVEDRRGKN
jgi:parvulin-like peptidyl-prolyl isomerase